MISIEAADDLLITFATPVINRVLPDHEALNGPLAALLHELKQADPRPSRTAVGGWQSDMDLIHSPLPEMVTLRNHVAQSVYHAESASHGHAVTPDDATISGQAWGNIMGDRDFAEPHNHMRHDNWSAVYYVDVERGEPEPERNGWLVLLDPRGTIQHNAGPPPYHMPTRELLIQPTNGRLVVFPSWMKHAVYAFHGPGRERISIAFNLRVDFIKR